MSFDLRISSLVLLSTFASILTGCTLATTAPDAPIAGPALHGSVYGGQQAVVGAHVYLMAATVSGVGPAGYGLASTSLLNAAATGNSDSVGAYVLTDAMGDFRLDAGSGSSTYDYTCPSSTTQVYLYVLGGNPGSGANNAASFMAALGSCGSLNSNQSITMNELTTVAAAYSLAGFATDALHISIPQYATAAQVENTTDALAQTDLQNAFATASNLVGNSTGVALTVTSSGNGTPATKQVIMLGNMLAACVNSSGPSSSNCTTLFNNAGSTGGATGTIPSDTATAAINIAHNPYVSSAVMNSLFGLQAASGAPFAGGNTSAPSDFMVTITYTGGGINQPQVIAIDSSGNVWTANFGNSSISEFSPTGATISSSSGYTGGGISTPAFLAIDSSGNVWVTNGRVSNSLSKFSSSGAAISTSSGYIGGGLNSPTGIAIDPSGNLWIANSGNSSLSEFSSGGTPNPSSPYTGGGLNAPYFLAIDGSGNLWTANYGNSSLGKFSSTGTAISSSSGYTGGGLNQPYSIAIDGIGNVWVTNQGTSSLSEFSPLGAAISSSSGYTGGGLQYSPGIAIDGSGYAWEVNVEEPHNVGIPGNIGKFSSSGTAISPSFGYVSGLDTPLATAIDGSGNIWVTHNDNNTPFALTELVGAATPVVTPLVANLISPYSAPASLP